MKLIKNGLMKKREAVQGLILKEGSDYQYHYLNISKYMNNKGFSASLKANCIAGLSEEGRFFYTEGLPKEDIWIIDNMKFSFPKVREIRFDNISCLGQALELDNINATKLMLLCCAEFGNHRETAVIKYEDGIMEDIPLEITSWLEESPAFNETKAWVGMAGVRDKAGTYLYPFPVHLYAIRHSIRGGEISRITLPNCPNIHIFAITLYEE